MWGDEMNEVNKTLYIPLYGKSEVSKKKIIINDPTAEKIWAKENFKVTGKAKSKWLTYNMAMRARILLVSYQVSKKDFLNLCLLVRYTKKYTGYMN